MKKITFIFSVLLLFGMSNLSAQNYALELDGNDDRVGVSNSDVLNPSDALTLEVWIKAKSWASAIWAGCVIGKQGNTGSDQGYCLTVGENGKAEFTVAINGAWVTATTEAIMGLESWYHIAGVYDGSSVKIYVNGVLQKTTQIASGTHTTGSTSLLFGDNPTWGGRSFDGTIDEVRIWGVARTEEEILENYKVELTGTEAGLAGYWNFNDGEGTTATDLSANGNNGTLLNMDANTAWVDGFVAATNDVGITNILSPYKIGPAYSANEKITVEIKNFSTVEASNFDVNYVLDDGEVKTETVTETIQPFGTLAYTFSEEVDLSAQPNWEIVAYTTMEGDVNSANDTLSEEIEATESAFIFDEVQHSFSSAGQVHVAKTSICSDLSGYSQILLHVDLKCPPGGCDPWDQLAYISLLHEGQSYELARYITPYGVPCGGWTFDITDFKSLLTGSVTFESRIIVWGASGWMLDAELELVPGTPEYEYSTIQPLVNQSHWVYGDETQNPHSPESVEVPIHKDAKAVKIRMTTTGHGQGNTANAAEFYEATHHVWLDGSETFEHHLWNNNCSENTCSPQSGTYTYSRAGWCPGQDVQPQEWFLAESQYTAGQNLDFEYVLAPYTNANNTGYNNSSHTEPYFLIHSYLVTYFNKIIDIEQKDALSNNISVFPNPATDYLNIKFLNSFACSLNIDIFDVVGKKIYASQVDKVSANDISSINLSDVKAGIYTLRVSSPTNTFEKKIIIK